MKKKERFIILQIVLAIFVFTRANSQICYTCPGNNNNVTGTAASAFGNNNVNSGSYSSALGSGNNISSTYSFIAGSFSTVQSLHSYIIGTSSIVNPGSTESYIFGSGSNAGNTKVMLIGHRLQSSAGSQIILGAGPIGGFLTCNKMYSLAVGFKSNVPTFFVGESPANGLTGKVGIGNNTDPLAKLHIKADAAENATLLLEATGTNKTASFLMGGGSAIIGTTSNNNSLSLVTGSINTRMFINGLNGNVGIGNNINPLTKLHIKANSNEDASILLEAMGSGKNSLMFLGHGIVGTTDTDFSINFMTGTKTRMFIYGENGNIGIGNNTDPQARLHILADEYQDATLLLDAAKSGKHTGFYFKGSPGQIATMDKEQPI